MAERFTTEKDPSTPSLQNHVYGTPGDNDVQAMFHQAPVTIVVYRGEKFVVEVANEIALAMWGKSAEEVVGRPFFDISPELETSQRPLLDGIMKTGLPFEGKEFHVEYLKNGTYYSGYFDFVYQPLRNSENVITGIIAVGTEVTQAVMARKKVEESEERYATIVNASRLGLWDFDVLNQKLVGAGNMAAIYGLPSNDAYTLEQVFKSIHPHDVEVQRKLFEDIVGGKVNTSFHTQYRIIREDTGETRWISAKGNAFFNNDGVLYRTAGTVADITEEKSIQQTIHESEARFRSLANAVPQVVWMAESNGTVTYYNDQLAKFEGARKLPGGNWEWEGLLHADDVEGTARAWERAVANATVYEKEHRIKVKNGGYRWHLSRAIPQLDEEGKVINWYGTATDIHDQKTFSEKLEQEVQQRTNELAEAVKELQRSNEDLQQFAHVASHDLKEPVRKVRIFASRLVDEFGHLLPEKGVGYLAKIENAADRMYAMIEGVLMYSSFTATEFATQYEAVNLDTLIPQVQSDLEVLMQQKEAVIEKEDLPVIHGSPVLLYQLFYNLINNSLKFSKPAVKPVITVSARQLSSSELQARRLDDKRGFVQVTVADNGIGFAGKDAEVIFKTFTRLNTKDQYEGTGLGLALCKKIVERHGGVIEAKGQEGSGAEFIITLPVM